MNKTEQNRIVAWRLKLLREASVMPRNVAQACRHFGIDRMELSTGKPLTSGSWQNPPPVCRRSLETLHLN